MRYSLFLLLIFIKPTPPETMILNYTEPHAPMWMWSSTLDEAPFPDSILTVVSYNIEFGLRFREAARELNSYPFKDADVILLQEMDEHSTVFLAEQLNYNYLYFPMNRHPKYGKRFGNAILSKWPLSKPEKIILPHKHPISRLKRGITAADITYGDLIIRTYSLHLETVLLSQSKRIGQLQWAMDHISTTAEDQPVIFGGDFNSGLYGDVKKMVEVCKNHDLAWNTQDIGSTFRRFGIIRPSMDHIFSRGFEHLASGKLRESSASDHSPIWSKLKVKS